MDRIEADALPHSRKRVADHETALQGLHRALGSWPAVAEALPIERSAKHCNEIAKGKRGASKEVAEAVLKCWNRGFYREADETLLTALQQVERLEAVFEETTRCAQSEEERTADEGVLEALSRMKEMVSEFESHTEQLKTILHRHADRLCDD